MKTLPACLLCGLLAAAPAAAADWSVSVGYGSGRLDAGQISRPSLLAKDAAGNVGVVRLSLGYDFSPTFGLEGSYLNFSESTTMLTVDPNVQTLVAPNTRFRCKAQALAVGPVVTWLPAEDWRIRLGAGAVLSDLTETFDGGGEGAQIYKTNGNPGWYGSIEGSYALAKELSVGASLRYLDFNRKTFSSSSLTAMHVEVLLAVRF
jgi:opacity protein-like surface antigen